MYIDLISSLYVQGLGKMFADFAQKDPSRARQNNKATKSLSALSPSLLFHLGNIKGRLACMADEKCGMALLDALGN